MPDSLPGAPWVWVIERADGTRIGRAARRAAAMRLIERPYRAGRFTVRHERTLEEWQRREGSWVKTRDGDPTRRPPAAAAVAAADPAAPEELAPPPWWVEL